MSPIARITSVVSAALLLVAAPTLRAQGAAGTPATGPVRDSVVAIVQEFFGAMEAGDSVRAGRTVHPQGTVFAVQVRGDSARMNVSAISGFPASVATSKTRLLERMWDPTVLLRGPVAVLWAAYDFHIDGKFSHCGVDSFTLTRTALGWRIVSIAYTVERTGCAPSPLGPIKSGELAPVPEP